MVHTRRYKVDSAFCPWHGRSGAFNPISVTKGFRSGLRRDGRGARATFTPDDSQLEVVALEQRVFLDPGIVQPEPALHLEEAGRDAVLRAVELAGALGEHLVGVFLGTEVARRALRDDALGARQV